MSNGYNSFNTLPLVCKRVGKFSTNLENHLEAYSRWGGEAEHAEVPDESRGDRVAAATRWGTRSTDDHILFCVVCVYV